MEHRDIDAIAASAHRALNRLAKWRSVFAGWQLGTRADTDGPVRAVRDHREATLLQRAELSALTGLLVDKGVFSIADFNEKVTEEAEHLADATAGRFPGMKATEHGIVYDLPQAQETMQRLGFPP